MFCLYYTIYIPQNIRLPVFSQRIQGEDVERFCKNCVLVFPQEQTLGKPMTQRKTQEKHHWEQKIFGS